MSSSLILNNGLQLPVVGLGTWKIKSKKVYNIIRQAIQCGYRHIDCAPIYGNQAAIGQAIADAIAEGDVTRSQLWITSKLWNSFHEPDQVLPALHNTLIELQLDFLDLYLIHWPIATKSSVGLSHALTMDDYLKPDQCPLIETWQAMSELSKQYVKSIGVSNCSRHHLENLIESGFTIPVMNQIECHPLLAQTALINFCHQHHIQVTAYSPLGSNDRPQRFKQPDELSLLSHPTIKRIAQRHQISVAQVLLAWGLQRQLVVIPKSSTDHHMRQNLEAMNVVLPQEAIDEINQLNSDYRFIAAEHYCDANSPYTVDYMWG